MYEFLFNPVACHGKSSRVLDRITKIFDDAGRKYEIRTSEYKGHLTELAREASETDNEGIVVIGGDGSVLEVASGILGKDVKFGIIPAGTGNDFVRSIGVGNDPEYAAKAILNGKLKKVDIGQNEKGDCFINVAGVGFDTEVIRFTEKFKFFHGMVPYVFGLFCSLFVYHGTNVDITIDGQKSSHRLFLLAIGNGRTYGGGMNVCPSASPFDGFFDLTVFDKLSNLKVPFKLISFISGKHENIKEIHNLRCREIRVETEKPLPINMDGEIIGSTPMSFRIVEGALTLFIP